MKIEVLSELLHKKAKQAEILMILRIPAFLFLQDLLAVFSSEYLL